MDNFSVSDIPKLLHVFLDSSVIVSALISSKGASAELIRLAERGKIQGVTSSYATEEIHHVLTRKAPQLIPSFNNLFDLDIIHIVSSPSLKDVHRAKRMITDPNDAPILASAMQHHVNYLVTLDRNDFILDPSVTEKSRLSIVTPGQLLKIVKSK